MINNPRAPDYLPARMLNEYVYCPRLFYYMWVESVFAHNRETVEGSLRHSKIDSRMMRPPLHWPTPGVPRLLTRRQYRCELAAWLRRSR